MPSCSLLRALPQPTLLRLCGEDYHVSQLQVRDLAALQGFLEIQLPHPLEAIRDKLPGLPPDERDRLLIRAYRAARSYPPLVFDGEFTRVFSTISGTAMFLGLLLRKHQDVGVSRLLEVATTISPEEYTAVNRVAYAADPQDELERLMADEEDSVSPPRDDWGAMIDELARSHGWTYDVIGDLVVS